MAVVVDWFGDGKIEAECRPQHFLRLQGGNTYPLRLIGPPVRFARFIVGEVSAICDETVGMVITKTYGVHPLVRYAAHALLLQNVAEYVSGRIYALEFSRGLYNDICRLGREYCSAIGTNFDCNFTLTVDGEGIRTKIHVTALQYRPSEANFGDLKPVRPLYDLETLFHGLSAAEVVQQLKLKPAR